MKQLNLFSFFKPKGQGAHVTAPQVEDKIVGKDVVVVDDSEEEEDEEVVPIPISRAARSTMKRRNVVLSSDEEDGDEVSRPANQPAGAEVDEIIVISSDSEMEEEEVLPPVKTGIRPFGKHRRLISVSESENEDEMPSPLKTGRPVRRHTRIVSSTDKEGPLAETNARRLSRGRNLPTSVSDEEEGNVPQAATTAGGLSRDGSLSLSNDDSDSELPPPKRIRSVGVARKLKIPSLKEPSSVARLDPTFSRGDISIGTLSFDIIRSVTNTILTYVRQSSPSAEYTWVTDCIDATLLASIFIGATVASTASLLSSLAQGRVPDSWHGLERITPTRDHNVIGTYIHLGRVTDERPFTRGVYVGSGVGYHPQSAFSFGNLVGVLRRVICQHGSPRYREKNPSSHYKYLTGREDYSQQFFVTSSFLYDEEMDSLLQRQNQPPAVNPRTVRGALIKILESCTILLIGAYSHDRIMNSISARFGFTSPRFPSDVLRLTNRSVGCETVGFSGCSAEHASRAGKLAMLTFGKMMGLPEGVGASLTALAMKRWIDAGRIGLNHLQQAGENTWRNKLIREGGGLILGESFQRNLSPQNTPSVDLYNGSRDRLIPYVPTHLADVLPVRFRLEFKVLEQSGNKYIRPPPGVLHFILDRSRWTSSSLPTIEFIKLVPYILDPITKVMTPLYRDNRKTVPVEWCLETCLQWDLSTDGPTKRKSRSEDGHTFSYSEQFEVFYSYLQLCDDLIQDVYDEVA